MWKVANLDHQYCANMVPLIFAQEWGHLSVIFAYKILKLCNFYWKIMNFDPRFCANWQVWESAPKWPIKLYFILVLWPMFPHKLTGMGVCTKNAPSNYTSYQSSKRPVATGLRLVFSLFQNPGNCNRTNHQRAWTATAVWLQPMVSPVQLPVFWKVLDRTLEHYLAFDCYAGTRSQCK